MPTTRRRRTRDRLTGAEGLTAVIYTFLSSGDFFEAEGFADGKSEAELRRLWTKHRAAVMARYSAECRQKGPGWAGERPWPFWKWEDREPRRPTPPREFSSQKVWDRQRRMYDWVETDWEYLRRLGLLEPWELDAGDPDKVTGIFECRGEAARHADD